MTAYSDRSYETAHPPAASAAGRRLLFDPTRAIDDAAFAAASRHTARVKQLKVVLPALAVVGAVVFWGAMHFIPSDFGSIANGVDITSNSVVMNKPHISGFEGTKRAYEVQADSASQSLSDPKIVTFSQITANIGLDTAGTAKLNAKIGVYDGNKNTLALKDGIVITTDTGAKATIDQAAVDLGKGSLDSPVPIVITMPQGNVHANAISVTDRGKHVVLTGGVSISYLPSGNLAAPSVNK